MLAVLLLFAEQEAANPPQRPPGQPGIMDYLPMFVMLAAVFYFMVLRPQQRQARDLQTQMAGLKKDDEVVTTGGIVGTVVSIKKDKDEVVIESMNARFKVLKSAILRVIKPSEAAEEPVAGQDEKEERK